MKLIISLDRVDEAEQLKGLSPEEREKVLDRRKEALAEIEQRKADGKPAGRIQCFDFRVDLEGASLDELLEGGEDPESYLIRGPEMAIMEALYRLLTGCPEKDQPGVLVHAAEMAKMISADAAKHCHANAQAQRMEERSQHAPGHC